MANPIGMDRPILAAAATLSLLLSVGCGARPDWVTAPQPLFGPVALNSHMVWVSSAREEILVVDPAADVSAGERRLRRFALDDLPTELQLIPGTDGAAPPRGLALLTPSSSLLHLVSEDEATGAITHRSVKLKQGYDQLAFAADGVYGLAWMGPAAKQQQLISVVGKVAVLDVARLLAGEEDAIVEQDLNLEEAPKIASQGGVIFSGAMPLFPGETPLRLAAVASRTRVALLDLGKPELRARTIFLDPGVSPDVVRFTDGLAPEAGSEYLLFTSKDSANSDRGISTYRILPEDAAASPETENEPRIRLTYDLLLPDDPPVHFEVFPDPSGRRILVVSVGQSAQRATVFELFSSSIGQTVTFPDGVRANHVMRAPNPGAELAVLFEDPDRGGGHKRLIYLDIDAASQGRPEAELGEAFADNVRIVTLVPQRPGRVLVQLEDSPQLELVDLTGPHPRSTSIRLNARAFPKWDSRGGSFYVATAQGNLLGRVKLDAQGEPSSDILALDAPPGSRSDGVGAVHLLEGAGLVVVDHGLPQGAITVVPVDDLTREAARTIDGIFLDGIFDLAAGRDSE
jgi:hypothetical protein